MTPKSGVLGIVLLFAYFLLLTPLVQSCFFFYATESDKGNGYASVQLYENHSMVCDYYGLPAPVPAPSPSPSSPASPSPSPSGGDLNWLYTLSCIEGYSATFDVDSTTLYGVVVYSRPGDTLGFGAPGDGGLWEVCESGCTETQCSVSG